jgi:hypothetical protein
MYRVNAIENRMNYFPYWVDIFAAICCLPLEVNPAKSRFQMISGMVPVNFFGHKEA